MLKEDIEEFIRQFQLPRDGFTSGVSFSDAFGFSTSKPRMQNGLNFESLYKFYIRPEDLRKDGPMKPVTVVVSYGERMSDGSIRLSPTSIPRKANWPVDFASTDEFFFDTKTGKLSHKNQNITASEMLRIVENLHLRPTRISGIFLRFKFHLRTVFSSLLRFFYNTEIYILWVMFGTWTTKSIWFINDRRDTSERDTRVNPDSFAAKTISIFGYSASAWAVVTYSIVHLFVYSIWYYFSIEKHPLIVSIFSNNFLTISYVVPSLVFYEKLLSTSLEWMIRKTGAAFHKVAFAPILLDF